MRATTYRAMITIGDLQLANRVAMPRRESQLVDNGEDQVEVDEAELVDYMRGLAEMERESCERTQLAVGPYTAMVMIGSLQLATRHPQMSPLHRRMLREVVHQLEPLFAGTLGEEIIRRGGHPEFDE